MAEFGRRIGYSPTHVKRLEEGTTPISEGCIDRICDVFKVDPRYFTDSVSSVTSLGTGADTEEEDELDRLLSMYLKTLQCH